MPNGWIAGTGACTLAVVAVAMLTLSAGAQTVEPSRSALRLDLVEFATLPDSSGARMMELTFAPGVDDALFVTVQEGQILRMDRTGIVEATPFLDLATTNIAGATAGSLPLRYLAFHPDFVRAGAPGFGRFYTTVAVTPTEAPDDDTDLLSEAITGPNRHGWAVIEWTVTDPTGAMTVDTTSGRVVLRLHYTTPAGSPHGLNDLAFDTTLEPGDTGYGLLYVSSGDNGDGVVGVDGPYAQRLDNLFGKILRINPIPGPGGAYSSPAVNPFVSTAGARTEIFAYGLRNPQNLSLATVGGQTRLIASDIGFDSAEEVNVVVAGGNYGWDAFEGLDPENATPVGALGSLREPVALYGHDLPSNQLTAPAVNAGGPTAIAGGQVYRGSRAPSLAGQYIFGDIARGRFFHTPIAGVGAAYSQGTQTPLQELLVYVDDVEVLFPALVGSPRGDVRFGRDQDGELYVLNKSDRIIRWLAEEMPVPPDPGDGGDPDEPKVPSACAGAAAAYNVVIGTPGDDRLTGTSGRDFIVSFGGDDVVVGLGGRDCIVAGAGRDVVRSGAGADLVIGRAGGDTLRGGSGPDHLVGGPGDDRLIGGRGRDLCDGGGGNDLVTGCQENE